MLGIKDYKPFFLTSASEFTEAHQKELKNIIGKKIESYHLQWDTNENEWNKDGPIILMIAGKQYEFTAFRLDEYSLTINRIDLSEKLDWYGGGDEFPLIWKKNPITNVNSILNKEIEDIHLLEYSMILDNENRNFFRQLTKHDFILVGIEFRLKELENCLHLSNGLDCNEMKIHTTKNDIINRRVQIK